ncbi:hypothetical protein AVEN_6828-1, partial [Araneus ventricosus]
MMAQSTVLSDLNINCHPSRLSDGLSFASSDRALVWIPDEPNAGKSTFTVRSQCKPRLAVFAILSVFFPLIVFLGVAFVVRADRDRIMRIYSCRGRLERERQERSDS